jgi:uncharacterized repeat protein (TIGR03803 family)
MRKPRIRIAMLVLAIAASTTGAHAQATPTVLYNFGSHTGDPIDPELAYWTQGRDGNLYTTAPTGGANGDGAAFYYSFSTGLVTLVHSFMGADGSAPFSGLTLGTDGNFYGTTSAGGANGAGTVFQISGATLAFKTLYSFTNGSDGGTPYAPPVEGPNGLFYGTTATGGGAAGCGTVYSISTSGAPPTTLHQFAGSSGSDGCTPIAPLALGNDGYFYGTTNVGGTSFYQAGTVFKIGPSGQLTVLYNFDNTHGYEPNGLILGGDGKFYGTTAAGGTTGYGVVFGITSAGALQVGYNFKGGKSDGAQPYTALVQATNGELYGVTTGGGENGDGTIFGGGRPTPPFAVVYSFVQNTTGDIPEAPFIQRTDGLLYGDTFRGGSNGEGTFFSLDLGLDPFVSLVSTSGQVGQTIGVLGQGFTAQTSVSFNGTAASAVHVPSATFLAATVPAGATTGFVTVTTSSITLTSNKQFRVTP